MSTRNHTVSNILHIKQQIVSILLSEVAQKEIEKIENVIIFHYDVNCSEIIHFSFFYQYSIRCKLTAVDMNEAKTNKLNWNDFAQTIFFQKQIV